MASRLDGVRVAILATDGFEQSELVEPRKALMNEGAQVHIVAPKSGQIRGWDKVDWSYEINVDKQLSETSPDEYDSLMIPGGVMNPDHLREDKDAVEFVRSFFESGKPIASICHGPWMLVEADVVKGRRMTSYNSIKTDLINAGADWVDEEVVTDNGIVTSRKPDDIPAFNKKMIEEFAEGQHQRQSQNRSASTESSLHTQH